MRLLVLSDLHVEYADFTPGPRARECDVVVLAGDIGQGPLALQWARRTFAHQPIVQIAGNHEYFNTVHAAAREAQRRQAERLDIHWLDGDRVVIGDVEFLGCTLWTDYRLYERPGRPRFMSAEQAMQASQALMLYYRRILLGDDGGPVRPFTPQDSSQLHASARHWLTRALSEPRTTRARVVVTPHLPCWHSVSPDFLAASSNPAFASDMEDCLPRADLWIHGHTHSSHDYLAAGCRVVCNPRGYPMRRGGFENPRFVGDRMICV
ncbi:MAG: metallophosphoesterase family protein [Burkholderiaceae bacterium]